MNEGHRDIGEGMLSHLHWLVTRPDAVQVYPVVLRSETPAAGRWTPLP